MGDNTSPGQNSIVHYQTQKNQDDTSSCIAPLNICSSLSKINGNLPHSSDMMETVEKSKKLLVQNIWKICSSKSTNTMWPLWSHPSFRFVDFLFQHNTNQGNTQRGQAKAYQVKTKAEVDTAMQVYRTAEAPQPQVRWREGGRRQRDWRRWGGLQSHHPPASLWRWLQRWGHQHQWGRNQPKRNSS